MEDEFTLLNDHCTEVFFTVTDDAEASFSIRTELESPTDGNEPKNQTKASRPNDGGATGFSRPRDNQ